MISKQKGTIDLKGNDALIWNHVNNVVSEFMDLYNYEFIRTPVFEASELFHRSVGESSDIVKKETYDFKDKGDRDITLRPEGTASVVRSYLEDKEYSLPDCKKYYYNEPMYRYERPQSGRLREFTQYGIEVLGSNDSVIDAEVISIAYRIPEALGFNNLQVNINSLGDEESRKNYREALVNHFEPYISELCEDCKERFKINPLRILDCKVDCEHKAIKDAPKTIDYLNEESKKRFDEVLKYLDLMEIDYEVDPKIVRGLDYYDHTVFELVSLDSYNKSTDVLAGGGRYNKLFKELDGNDNYGIGFASGIDRLVLKMKEMDLYKNISNSVDAYIMYVNEEEKLYATKFAQELRLNGVKCELDNMGRGLKGQFKAADRLNSKFLIILNSEDLNKGLVTIKDNVTKEENKIDETEIVDYMLSNI